MSKARSSDDGSGKDGGLPFMALLKRTMSTIRLALLEFLRIAKAPPWGHIDASPGGCSRPWVLRAPTMIVACGDGVVTTRTIQSATSDPEAGTTSYHMFLGMGTFPTSLNPCRGAPLAYDSYDAWGCGVMQNEPLYLRRQNTQNFTQAPHEVRDSKIPGELAAPLSEP